MKTQGRSDFSKINEHFIVKLHQFEQYFPIIEKTSKYTILVSSLTELIQLYKNTKE